MKKILRLMVLGVGLMAETASAEEAVQSANQQSEASIFGGDAPFLPSAQQDPLESINRPIFEFNQTMDKILINPIVKIYNTLIPSPVRTAADNFFDNIATLPSIANDLLQGELMHALNDSWRFIINSTFGLGGLYDAATEFGLPEHFNDLGITLAHWGYRNSTYLVLPFLGPTTVRDGIGFLGDYYMTPYPYAIHSTYLLKGVLVYRYLTIKAQLIDADNFMNEAALDPYIFERDAYYQYRNHKIETGSNADNSEFLYLEENEPQDEKKGLPANPGANYISE